MSDLDPDRGEDRPPPATRQPLPFYYRLISTWIGAIGTVVLVSATVSFFFLLIMELLRGETSPYVGLFHYLILPLVGTLAAALVALGYWLDRRRGLAGKRRHETRTSLEIRRPEVQQGVIVVMGLSAGLLVFLMALGGQRAFEYSESTSFCGEICHVPMEPEFVAHQRSPHAKVSCTDCHIGTGLDHFIAAKLRGMQQVVAVLGNSYERPIATPVADMRESRDICERCHWALYDVGQVHKRYAYYSSEGLEEPWELDMLLKVGGGDPERGSIRGIHWHMNLSNRVEYIARDARRQDIPWVRVTEPDGNVSVYRNFDEPPSAELEAQGEVRRMECLDCHNRPAHRFESPVRLVNRAMAAGRIDVAALPEIKLTALEALAGDYESTEAAHAGVADSVEEFYADLYPEVLADNRPALDQAIATLQSFYGDQMFPTMNADWSAYPDNIGHWREPGCFRCHGGLHESDDGGTISTSCDTCHTIVRQGLAGEPEVAVPEGLPFVHPWDGDVLEPPILCSECHDGVLGLRR
jgi:hypothetical protein